MSVAFTAEISTPTAPPLGTGVQVEPLKCRNPERRETQMSLAEMTSMSYTESPPGDPPRGVHCVPSQWAIVLPMYELPIAHTSLVLTTSTLRREPSSPT